MAAAKPLKSSGPVGGHGWRRNYEIGLRGLCCGTRRTAAAGKCGNKMGRTKTSRVTEKKAVLLHYGYKFGSTTNSSIRCWQSSAKGLVNGKMGELCGLMYRKTKL